MIQGDPHRSDLSTGPEERARGWQMPGLRRLVALVGAVLVTLGLAGCNSAEAEPEPDPLDDIEVDPQLDDDQESTDDDPEDDEPEDEAIGPQDYEHPEPGPDIDDDGQAGAEAAAVYFVELYSYIYATGDFEAWDELTTEDCNFCSGVRGRILDLYEGGGYARTGEPAIVDSVSQIWHDDPGDFVVDMRVQAAGTGTFASDGTLIAESAAEEVRILVLAEHVGGHWKVVGGDAEEAE